MAEEESAEIIEAQIQDMDEEDQEERIQTDQELREELSEEDAMGYGNPVQAEELDKIKFLKDVSLSPDTIRTTLLTKGELGIPLFSVRFYLGQVQRAALHDLLIVALYYKNKSFTTTDTGLSREGFLMNLAVTKKKELSKKRSVKEVKSDKPK